VAVRIRQVIWTESARQALDEVVTFIARDSTARAAGVLSRALDRAASLSTLAERPESFEK
jgi:plasmid stabilization system protein ParE